MRTKKKDLSVWRTSSVDGSAKTAAGPVLSALFMVARWSALECSMAASFSTSAVLAAGTVVDELPAGESWGLLFAMMSDPKKYVSSACPRRVAVFA